MTRSRRRLSRRRSAATRESARCDGMALADMGCSYEAPVARFSPRSNASKLRQRRFPAVWRRARLTSSGTFCSDVPPCERSGTSSPDRSCRSRLVPMTVSSRDTTTRSPMRSAGSSNCAAALRARQHRFDAGQRRDPLGDRALIRGCGQVRERKGAERAVVHDIRVGDRQDHPRLALCRARHRGCPAGKSRWVGRRRRAWRSCRDRR